MIVQALKDQGVDTVFGYPGGAVLPIYDEIFLQNDIRHYLVRHEQVALQYRRTKPKQIALPSRDSDRLLGQNR